MMTVLITGCNNHFQGIERCLHDNYENERIITIGTDCNPNHLIGTGCTKTYVVPRSDNPDYIPKMLEICKENSVDVILPFVTTELLIMAKNKDKFDAIGTKVSVSSLESIMIANDKIELYKSFPDLMPYQTVIETPEEVDAFAEKIGYPKTKFCCKIPDGCGGNGFSVIDEKLGRNIRLRNKCGVAGHITKDMLKELVANFDGKIILSEYITGKDYSVCVLADRGKALYKCGYIGYEMDYGCVLLGEILQNEMAYDIADRVCAELGLDGNVCFDFMVDSNGKASLLEINPRLSASLAFVAAAGLNLPYLRCKQLLGTDVRRYSPEVKYGLKMRKFYECEYTL